MEIERINGYQDSRFSPKALRQHGCYLVQDQPYEVEIISEETAVIKGKRQELFPEVIDVFRFHAPHITVFLNTEGGLVKEYPPVPRFPIALDRIQPSQFYVDCEKLAAVQDFITSWNEIVIPVIAAGERYIALDGHTRLYFAAIHHWNKVYAVLDTAGDYIWDFVHEARSRQIVTPKDLELLRHEEYVRRWDSYCEAYFSKRNAAT